ncbi:RHH-type proline utilization regulon transcriptional repressor/proline dehydrogenase/delta 1-pyrroline-5-carboxylate dehydrogenase [Silvimonas terrae]|uniref:Bifunctional protein PutA n=1 Tax=Silvimonas terrae TaxID=300266 RepID=A0A840R9I5_9NEIS|nr:trifunctional transcriptional regulator/proline dehydrogenase/L-glutamate gamma-semialdehyde dehydrogenase [Silvimonas terrae]MBB5189567.1 RHH-type proline utilization regulon transcriptional repressor/proline dehydrogenase/delta 1-pyrroline-5-carboxylate dehydrogenase [Silvimonas terrae]
MSTTTLGVKLDETTRERLKQAALKLERTPHWLIKQAIFNTLEQIERGQPLVTSQVTDETTSAAAEVAPEQHLPVQPFLEFAQSVQPQSVLRAAITAAYRRPEPECLPALLEQARLPQATAEYAQQLARKLAATLREQQVGTGRDGLVQGLIQEFSLNSQEGVALMCLAEALLRIPDKATRDALIRDKIARGNWYSHVGQSPSLFVNAATWGLLLTGKLVTTHTESGLSSALTRIIGKGGEPLVRKGVDMAMRLMGEQFVTGETISEALANARKFEAEGFRYSYDMLGEAAMTEADAQRYLASYEQAIRAIGRAAQGRGIYEGPGISIKLSALHPRYSRAQYERVHSELYPRLKSLAVLARQFDIGINIDAEEADRLEISLDLLERLCFEPDLAGWNGIGFVVQAYQKRCPYVLDYLIDLARRSRHRLMIRLVKGAYWDSEIKRAQVDGLEGYPVYTRKVYTDVSYLACARKLLAVPEAVYPQFATHNAHTLATIYHLAGQNYYPGQYEFQCLHGMGEPLYEQVVGKLADGKLNRPCRIYAPVGTHETLLAYLVRRLLENGANTSFVNRIGDETISLDELIADPVSVVEEMHLNEGALGLPHPRIALPAQLYGATRTNSAGLDLSNEQRLASLSAALLHGADEPWRATPLIEGVTPASTGGAALLNPAEHHDVVGHVIEATLADVDAAMQAAVHEAPVWQATPPDQRAILLERAADLMEGRMQQLMGLIVREAGKSLPNAIAEVREAVDFLRYYAAQVRTHFSNDTHRPLGPVVCISPWNFPLAIFTGQVSAALAAGNTVLAKPAEQTPLIAAQAVAILHEAGIPAGAVQLLPGQGETVGAALVNDARTRGVMFTGSTQVARILQRSLSGRLSASGAPIPLIAETGGQNAMIVDSSALTEQVVADVLASAFDSAGQRCSALRVLCLQEDIADRVLNMLKGGMQELVVGNPDRLATDVGPVIDAEAQASIQNHIDTLYGKGRKVYQAGEPEAGRYGTFIAPTLIELDSIAELEREVFGPVLHVVRWQRTADNAGLDQLLEQINATGYGLTMGVHTRIDETIAHIVARAQVGNLYVNRNVVGAVVGVQPFGGEGLSGTGPKAGGPLYLHRLLAVCPQDALQKTITHQADQSAATQRTALLQPFESLWQWAREHQPALAALCEKLAVATVTGSTLTLAGPTGERNTYALLPRETVLCVAGAEDVLRQLATVLAVGARAVIVQRAGIKELVSRLPKTVNERITLVEATADLKTLAFDAVLQHGDSDELRALSQALAERDGPIVGVQGLPAGGEEFALERLLIERALSVNTAAAGGNASLMTIG